MRKKQSLIRILSFILMVALLISAIPFSVIAVSEAPRSPDADVDEVIILHNGAEVPSLTLSESGKETLTAFISADEYDSRAWQIRVPDTEQWVSIADKSGDTLDVTYALIRSMLDGNGKAYLRHVITKGETVIASDPIAIAVAYVTPESHETPKEEAPMMFAAKRAATVAEEETEEDPDQNQLVSIVINYVFDNGDIAFEPYGASIAKGSAFNATVKSPTVVGYDPFRRIDGDYIDAKEIVIDLQSVNENITINVIYEPALVEFQIHHHLQNINDDEYSLPDEYITKAYGLTGSKIPDALAMDIEGFSPLAYEKDIIIAADGSTVVEIKYDRNYYLVSFEMAGGYGTDPVYARYGTPVGANPPTRHGYVFAGWELISYADAAPSDKQKSTYDINGEGKTIDLPAANLKYLAKWTTQLTTYTMVFWKENIDDNGFTYWGYLDGLQAMSGSVVSGSDRAEEADGVTDQEHFTYCDALTDKDVIVEGDGSTIVNVYYTRNRYTITFKAPGKCTIEPNHTHTRENCYVTICSAGHVHDESCSPELSCTIPEHSAHTSECIICGIEEHVHSDSCYCGKAEHTHTKDCWNNVGDAQNNKPSGAPNNPEDGEIHTTGYLSWNRKYYIYIKGTWYAFEGSGASNGDTVKPSCGNTEHTHAGSCTIKCGHNSEHEHVASCYSDTLHTHETDCYTYSCGDTEHVHTDGCYLLHCGIPTGHTHNSTCNSSNGTNTVKIVYAKYQENLEHIWPITDGNGVTYDSGERWEPSNSDNFSAVLVFIANMPDENFTLTLNKSSASTYTMNYYLQVLPGEEYTTTYEDKNYKLYTTIKANYNYLTKAEDFFDINGYSQYKSNPAFGSNGQIKINTSDKTVNFYYTRYVDHKLEFSSSGQVIDTHTQTGIMYGAPLSQYNFTPDYPHNLEQGAYEFGGWYTSPGCYDGTEVNWDTVTMEAGGMLFYAKWKPVVYDIEVYNERTADGEYIGKLGETQHISHNHFAHQPSQSPEKGNYVFQGWFYIDQEDGKEKAFVFSGIPINQDMKIYAKWGSDVSVKYTIKYVLKDGTQIADPLTGSGIAGHNKTFNAKIGNELYAGYREGYYPHTSSHTITMNAEVEEHIFEFKYTYVEAVPYEVRYVDKNGNELIQPKKVMDNRHAVVTETFEKVTKMMPDAYQKRLVLSAEGTDADNNGILDNNVITFTYEMDEIHAYYKVVHYIQHISDEGYREYRSEETKGVIGDTYSISPITLEGFAFNPDKTMLNGAPVTVTGDSVNAKLGEDGMIIELYYDRVNVSYVVNYLEYETNRVLYTQKVGTGLYGGQVVEEAIGLTHMGYTLASNTSVKQLNLSANSENNVIDFYYTESNYSLKYEIVGSPEGGSLSSSSENVLAVSGNSGGSTPTVYTGYKFVGWFLDEACSKPVPAEWVDANNKITPQKDGNGVWISSRTFYAKIEPNVTSLTIKTLGAVGTDENQSFIYRIKGTSENVKHIDFTVTVIGNGSVTVTDLVLGEYTVTEITDWSYRYSPDSAEKNISLTVDPSKNTVTFSHIRTFTQWLDYTHNITNVDNGN